MNRPLLPWLLIALVVATFVDDAGAVCTADPCDDVVAADDNEYLTVPSTVAAERRASREGFSFVRETLPRPTAGHRAARNALGRNPAPKQRLPLEMLMSWLC